MTSVSGGPALPCKLYNTALPSGKATNNSAEWYPSSDVMVSGKYCTSTEASPPAGMDTSAGARKCSSNSECFNVGATKIGFCVGFLMDTCSMHSFLATLSKATVCFDSSGCGTQAPTQDNRSGAAPSTNNCMPSIRTSLLTAFGLNVTSNATSVSGRRAPSSGDTVNKSPIVRWFHWNRVAMSPAFSNINFRVLLEPSHTAPKANVSVLRTTSMPVARPETLANGRKPPA
mmetsp:Transcript_26466/g.68746  ORF Transcript_26466/g.68746 Transcript_26466/m.68746 type:complete len:230 (-) Transcript_26466:2411-3100(-)